MIQIRTISRPNRDDTLRALDVALHPPTAFLYLALIAATLVMASAAPSDPAGPFFLAILSISAMSGAGRGNYYLSLAREDYYTKGGEPLGVYLGKGAEALGLEGTVQPRELRNLLLGRSPNGGLDLVRNAGQDDRQSGWDFCFSPPKSVSATWSLAPSEVRQQIQRAQFEAVRDTFAFLEREAGIVRLGAGGQVHEKAGLVAAAFEHGTSRAQDPQLHTHLLVINLGVSGGTTRTIASRPLYRLKMLAGRHYRELLAANLQRDLGVEIRRSRWGFEIEGIPERICSAYSSRREQIVSALAERGLTSAIAAKIAALNTRPVKQVLPREQLFAMWQEKGRELGFGPREVELLLARARERNIADRRALAAATHRESDGATTSPASPVANPASAPRPPSLTELEKGGLEPYHSRLRTNPVFGRRLFRIPFTKIEFRLATNRLFHKAPPFSPFKDFKVPILGFARKDEPFWKSKYYLPKPLFEKRIGFWTIAIRGKYRFPNAPRWSPFHGLYRKVLRVSFRPTLLEISERRRRQLTELHPPPPERQRRQSQELSR